MCDVHPRVLVVSNNCFSTTGSNGRTLAGLFEGWPVDALAQFYISSEIPDSSVCREYFRVTDREALRSVLSRRGSTGGVVNAQGPGGLEGTPSLLMTRVRKTALTSLVRDTVWHIGAWPHGGFWSWVDGFAPELVLLQAGDAPFMYRVATGVSARLGIPLVIYNSEDYYFKAHDYMTPTGGFLSRLMYGIFRRRLISATDGAMAVAAHVVHLTDDLREEFDPVFDVPATAVMTTTTVTADLPRASTTVPQISYLGNLGLGRHTSLMEIASALQAIDASLVIDVYGRAASEDIMKEMTQAFGIRFHGFVSYDETIELMRQSTLLIHTESFLPFYREDIKHGFSTKIADSLASGTCLLVYAPPELASVRYLQREGAACVVTDPTALRSALADLLSNESLRWSYAEKAADVVRRNHSLQATTFRFQTLLRAVAMSAGSASSAHQLDGRPS